VRRRKEENLTTFIFARCSVWYRMQYKSLWSNLMCSVWQILVANLYCFFFATSSSRRRLASEDHYISLLLTNRHIQALGSTQHTEHSHTSAEHMIFLLLGSPCSTSPKECSIAWHPWIRNKSQ
jgi:hypothetical protein